jgi:predicted nucleic acid-binding protein
MKKIFFDTWGWVAIAHKGDDHHEEVHRFYRSYLLKSGVPVTTDYVLAEAISLLRAKTHGVGVFIDTLLDAARAGRVLLERIDALRWGKAWTLSKKYSDKPAVSFADFCSFAVMKERGITEVLTADRHFEDVGMGFKKLF